jgi:hypothetical protein
MMFINELMAYALLEYLYCYFDWLSLLWQVYSLNFNNLAYMLKLESKDLLFVRVWDSDRAHPCKHCMLGVIYF